MGRDVISSYAAAQTPARAAICKSLRAQIDTSLPRATSKIWHAMPVWFVGENPVVGFKVTAKHVNLLFWNGQAFEEPGLKAAGKFKAAQIQFTDTAQIDTKKLRRWLKNAQTDVWDSVGFQKSKRDPLLT
jgi:hypothetical protein